MADAGHKVVLFGAGGLGRQTLACLRAASIEPLAFCDNNETLWQTTVDGLKVVAPQEAARLFGDVALFVVTIWNPFHWYSETKELLSQAGCRRITSASPVYWRFAESLLPFYAQDLPHKLLASKDDVLKASALWSDNESAAEFARQVAWRFSGEWAFTRPTDPTSYFRPELFHPLAEEVFIDCGAFDGDTLRAFLTARQQSFRHFIAIEPDECSYRKLVQSVDDLPSATRAKVSAIRSAVGAERSVVRFEGDGSISSRATSSGGNLVSCVPLSDLVPNSSRPVTFIKMDIEGAEIAALHGGAAIIKADRPLLAVCVYHTQDDLWRIPLLLHALLPDHGLHLRCHEGDGWQTVAYAVPPERAA